MAGDDGAHADTARGDGSGRSGGSGSGGGGGDTLALRVVTPSAPGALSLALPRAADTAQLKRALAAAHPLRPPPAAQRIVYAGRLLPDAARLCDALRPGDDDPVVHMVLRFDPPAAHAHAPATAAPAPPPTPAMQPLAAAPPAPAPLQPVLPVALPVAPGVHVVSINGMLYAMHVPAAPAALPHAAAAVPPWHAPVAAAPAPDPALHIAALAAHVPQPVLPQQPAQIPQQAQPVQPAQQPPQPQPQPQPQQPQQGAVGRLLAGIGGLGGALFGLLFLEDDGDAAAEPARPAAQENPVADAAMLLLKLVIIVLFFSQNASFERKLFLWGTAAIVFCLHVAAEPAAAIAANIVGRINALAQLVPANAAAAPPDAAPPNAAPDDAPAPADGPVPDPAPQGDGIPAIAPAIADPSLPMQALQILVSFFVSTVPGFEEPHAPAM